MELIVYLRIVWRWLWLIVLVAAVGAYYSYNAELDSYSPEYTTQAKIMIGRYYDDPEPSGGDITIARQLVSIYTVLLRQRDLLEDVIEELDLNKSTGSLSRAISTSVLQDTTILTITVRDSNPERAADIANELVRQLIIRSPSTLTDEQTDRIALADSQINDLVSKQREVQDQINAIDDQLDTATRSQFQVLTQDRVFLLSQYNELSTNIAQFASLITNLEDPVNSVSVFEEATVPTFAEEPDLILAAITGAVAGAVLVVAVLLMKEYFNPNLRSIREASKRLDVDFIGTVSKRREGWRQRMPKRLLLSKSNDPLLLEEFRTLRTSVVSTISTMFGREDTSYIVITSAYGKEGKSTVAANLAISLAMAGYKVGLVDADMRNSSLHELFDMPNENGLAHVIGGQNENFEDVPHTIDDLSQLVLDTPHANLKLIPSGFAAINANEILGSDEIRHIVHDLASDQQFDFILFDTPATLPVTDSVVLSANIGASVLFVIRSDASSTGTIQSVLEQFTDVNVHVMGVVLNQIGRDGGQPFSQRRVKRYVQGKQGAQRLLS